MNRTKDEKDEGNESTKSWLTKCKCPSGAADKPYTDLESVDVDFSKDEGSVIVVKANHAI